MEEAQVFLRILDTVRDNLKAVSAATSEEKQHVRWLLKRLSEAQRETKNAMKRLRGGDDKHFVNPPAFMHVLSAMALLTRQT